MSTPAANAFSLPVMTMQPIVGSASKESSARLSLDEERVERVQRMRG
jgi:hypothetical protein